MGFGPVFPAALLRCTADLRCASVNLAAFLAGRHLGYPPPSDADFLPHSGRLPPFLGAPILTHFSPNHLPKPPLATALLLRSHFVITASPATSRSLVLLGRICVGIGRWIHLELCLGFCLGCSPFTRIGWSGLRHYRPLVLLFLTMPPVFIFLSLARSLACLAKSSMSSSTLDLGRSISLAALSYCSLVTRRPRTS